MWVVVRSGHKSFSGARLPLVPVPQRSAAHSPPQPHRLCALLALRSLASGPSSFRAFGLRSIGASLCLFAGALPPPSASSMRGFASASGGVGGARLLHTTGPALLLWPMPAPLGRSHAWAWVPRVLSRLTGKPVFSVGCRWDGWCLMCPRNPMIFLAVRLSLP